MRFEEDRVGSYIRSEIDRSIGAYSADFHSPDHKPLILVALEHLREKGSIAVLDAGCGTGQALWGLKRQLESRASIPLQPKDLRFIGVSREDFSQESTLADVRKAVSVGEIEYVVGDLEKVQLPPSSFDLITLYEVLIHNSADKSEKIVQRLYAMLKPEGWLFASVDPQQFARWREVPGKVFTYMKKTPDGDQRLFLVIAKTK